MIPSQPIAHFYSAGINAGGKSTHQRLKDANNVVFPGRVLATGGRCEHQNQLERNKALADWGEIMSES
jgi:hypothetical protein